MVFCRTAYWHSVQAVTRALLLSGYVDNISYSHFTLDPDCKLRIRDSTQKTKCKLPFTHFQLFHTKQLNLELQNLTG